MSLDDLLGRIDELLAEPAPVDTRWHPDRCTCRVLRSWCGVAAPRPPAGRRRRALRATGLPYVIENVPGAAMVDPITLCGSMFGLGAQCGAEYRQLRRHRLFESNVPLRAPSCAHVGRSVGVYGGGPVGRSDTRRGGYQGTMAERVEAMGIDWMTRAELSQAIPPAYTEFIGYQLIGRMGRVAA